MDLPQGPFGPRDQIALRGRGLELHDDGVAAAGHRLQDYVDPAVPLILTVEEGIQHRYVGGLAEPAGTDELDWAQQDQAPRIAEAGADLIIGAHPHVLQPLGYCGDTPVVYSLGNFLFNSKPLDSCLVRVTLDENGLKQLQFLPARQEDCSVKLVEGAEKKRILQYMRDISPGVSIDADGYVTKQE